MQSLEQYIEKLGRQEELGVPCSIKNVLLGRSKAL